MCSLSLADAECSELMLILQLDALEHVCPAGAKHEWPMLFLPIREPADQQLKKNCCCCPHVVGLIQHGFHPLPPALEQLRCSICWREVAIQPITCTPSMAQQSSASQAGAGTAICDCLCTKINPTTRCLRDQTLVPADAHEFTLHEVRVL